ncbi:MAD2L1-binding protein [Trichomycterus rosablanca]|uniref:MAD2L1-binding protein n=1 Tax=Trichomycterus rosablanca TaxID=2290929 RepID=UPI002F35BADB
MDEEGFQPNSAACKIMTVNNPDSCSESRIHVTRCSDQSEREAEANRCAGQKQVCEFSAVANDGSNSNTASAHLPASSNAGMNDQIHHHAADIRPEALDGVETQDSTVAAHNQHQTDMVGSWQSDCGQVSVQQPVCDNDHEELERKAREEGRVDVVFPGSVMQDGCCRFVCELLKCILYQRQQLPMTYDQMVFFQKQQYASKQPEEAAVRKPTKTTGDSNWQRCQRTLREVDEVLSNLEAFFSLSYVPRVLFILGGSIVLPTELYEINMEALEVGGGDKNLRTSVCLRQLFRTLFVADLLSDVKPVRLMATTVMAFGHRDCSVEWFKPKVDFRVPTRVKRQVITLASHASVSSPESGHTRDWEDYIWFQAPVTIKGFCK